VAAVVAEIIEQAAQAQLDRVIMAEDLLLLLVLMMTPVAEEEALEALAEMREQMTAAKEAPA
jgi:hypothetical protein